MLALNGIDAAISQTKRRIIRTLAESDNCVASYSKEAQDLLEDLDQVINIKAIQFTNCLDQAKAFSPNNKIE